MTVPSLRPAARRTPAWLLWAAAVISVVASLAAIAVPGSARADSTSYDQMTGIGPTSSAVTTTWTNGLLDNTNTPIATANADRSSASPTSPESFMYNDFKNLSVTVSQTQDISHQGITVSWSGFTQTQKVGSVVQGNFLQMMECYGDASTGPTPEQCEYGSLGMLGSGVANPVLGERTGQLCTAGAAPSTTNPPSSADGSSPSRGCDPQESTDTDAVSPACPDADCNGGYFDVPFAPVSDPTSLDYTNNDTTYFSATDTDEVQMAVTAAGGVGQQQFETLTGTQAPGLGCGEQESDGTTRGCWLVIVPRGTYEPNGYRVNSGSVSSYLNTSPLSESNWDQRIQIHLDFAPVGSFCPPGTNEIQTYGTQLISRAMQSWQLSLNQSGNCNQVYGFSSVPEATTTQNFEAGGDVGMGFTTIPVGSEATRDGGTAPTGLPNILYAPVAVAATDFGFNINESSGYITTPVKLTPLLLAKALTQSYRQDLPDYFPDYSLNGPSWAASNPTNVSEDPQFQALNPEVPPQATGPIAPLLTEDHSAVNLQTWQWIDGDSTASSWLGGAPDSTDGNMVVDPDYVSLNLGKTPIDSYPRAYTGVLSYNLPGTNPPVTVTKQSLDLLPYTDNFDSAASTVLSANNADLSGPWDLGIESPSNTTGWWDKRGIEPAGQIFMWSADDTPDLAAYGLIPAQLCNDSGSTCISPSTTSVTAAVSDATADSAGLLQVNPASPGTGAYPLTDIIYAAIPTDQSAAALTDYADLISYAIGSGQTIGATPGDLPPGYLPLPSNLVTQAQAVVTQLQNLASPSPSASASASSTASSTASSSASDTAGSSSVSEATTSTDTSSAASSTTGTGTGLSGSTSGASPTPAPAATASSAATSPVSGLSTLPVSSSHSAAAAGASAASGSPVISLPPAQAAAGTTPQQAVGAIRWVLIAVAAGGGAFAGGGALLRSGGLPPWLRRRWE